MLSARLGAYRPFATNAARPVLIAGLGLLLAACGGGGGSSGGGGGGGGGGGNTAPIASFTATPTSGKAPLPVAFDASGSRDPDGSISSVQWNFGDTSTGTGTTTTHTYAAGGTFTATLTVTDNNGATATTTRTITVAPQTGTLKVTVKDSNNLPVPGAAVSAAMPGGTVSGTTDSAGVATVVNVPIGTGTVTVSRESFVTKAVPGVVINADAETPLAVTLERIRKAVGGVLTTSDPVATVSNGGSTLEFTIQVVVVNENSESVPGLPLSAFALQPCVPNAATAGSECVVGRPGDPATFDAGYVLDGTFAPTLAEIPGATPQPYAATLMFDQSASIIRNDPTDARLFSAKEFLKGLGGQDRAGLAAFAVTRDAVNGTALIEQQPVTIYPVGNPAFVADGTSFFPTLDALASKEGGGTPLYEAICRVMDFSVANAPGGLRQAAVVFTDGQNDVPNNVGFICPDIEDSIAKSQSTGVDIFTIGLSGEVDGLSLAALAEGGNGTFLFAEDTSQLITIYGSLGNLLSGSLSTYKLKYRITASQAGAFATDRKVRGQLRVTVGDALVTLPFVVRIF